MATAKFGFGQINNPTPASLNKLVRVFTISAGVFLLWLPTASYIPQHTQDILNSILGLLVALANALAPMFGVELPSNTKVPIQDVTAIDNKNIK